MKTRRMVKEGNKISIVWFGVKGVEKVENDDGTVSTKSIFYNENNKNDNYASGVEAVKNTLNEKLSVLKGELWTSPKFGVPLIDKVRNKGIIDAYIISIVSSVKEVIEIVGFESEIVDKNTYSAYLEINTSYGLISISI